MKFISLTKLQILSLVVCVATAAFLRFYQLGTTYNFAGDQGRDAIVMLQLVRGQKFPRKGPSTSVGNFNLGPFFYYFMAPSLALTGLDPLGPALFEALLGVMTTIVLFLFFKNRVSLPATFTGTLVYALLPTFIYYDRFAWNPNSIPLFFLIFVWSLSQVWRKFSWRWLVGVLISLGILLQLHLLTIALVGTVLVCLWVPSLKQRTKKLWQPLLATIAVAIISVISLAPFLIGLLRAKEAAGSIMQFQLVSLFERLVSEKLMTLQLLSGGSWLLILIFCVLILVGLVNLFYHKKSGKGLLIILGLSSIFTFLGLSVINSRIEAHYLFAPLMSALLFSVFGLDWLLPKIKNLPLRYVVVFFLIVSCVYYWLPQWQAVLVPKWVEVSQIRNEDQLIIDAAAAQPFQVAVLTEFSSDDPYVYFFQAENQPLVRAPQTAAQLFVICEAANKCQLDNNPHVEIIDFKAAHTGQIIKETQISDQPPIYKFAVANSK